MKPRSTIVFFGSFAVLTVVALAFSAQKPADPVQSRPARDDKAQRIGVLEVMLPITVLDKKQAFVEGLTRERFEIYEDGKRQSITRFDAPSNLPLDVALLMDTSNSVKLKLPFEKDAAEGFVSTVTSYRKKDRVLFATFDSKVELHQDFTDDLELLVRAIRKVKAGGYTKLYDGVYRVIEEKMANRQSSDSRKVLLIISDGSDTASEYSLSEVIELAQRHDVTVFGISTKNFSGITAGTVETEDDQELRELCEQTGGQLYLPSQKLELYRAFAKAAKNIRQEYVVYYTPINQDKSNKKRQIRVKLVRADGDLKHKKGYVYN